MYVCTVSSSIICSTSLPLRAGVVDDFWNSRKSAADLLVVGLQHDDGVLGHVDSSGRRGRRARAHRPGVDVDLPDRPAPKQECRWQGRGIEWSAPPRGARRRRRGRGHGLDAVRRRGRGRRAERARRGQRAGRRRLGRRASSRPRTRSGVPSAARRSPHRGSSPTCSARSTRSRRPARSSATSTSSGTGSRGARLPTCSPTRCPTGGRRSCAARPTTPPPASRRAPRVTGTPGCGW